MKNKMSNFVRNGLLAGRGSLEFPIRNVVLARLCILLNLELLRLRSAVEI